VADVAPDFRRLAHLTIGTVSVFAHDAEGVKTRVFAPGAGVFEDPATGSAAGPLAVHLLRHGRLAFGETVRFEQGVEMGRPSELFVRLSGEGARVEQIEVGGGVQVVARGEFRLT
jgi:trans-2,3-dihydro-3-hydroxyanthranilate isomerase